MIRLIALTLAAGLIMSTAANAHDPDGFHAPNAAAAASKPVPRTCDELADPAYSANTAIKDIRELKASCDAKSKATEEAKPAQAASEQR